MVTKFYHGHDVDTEKLADFYRRLADDIESGDGPVTEFSAHREIDAEDVTELQFEVTVLEKMDRNMMEEAIDVYCEQFHDQ